MQNPLERIRKEYGLTREQMAAVMGTSYVSYSTYIRGAAFPGLKKLQLVASFFKIDLEDLIHAIDEWKRYLIQKRREEALKKVKAKNSGGGR